MCTLCGNIKQFSVDILPPSFRLVALLPHNPPLAALQINSGLDEGSPRLVAQRSVTVVWHASASETRRRVCLVPIDDDDLDMCSAHYVYDAMHK